MRKHLLVCFVVLLLCTGAEAQVDVIVNKDLTANGYSLDYMYVADEKIYIRRSGKMGMEISILDEDLAIRKTEVMMDAAAVKSATQYFAHFLEDGIHLVVASFDKKTKVYSFKVKIYNYNLELQSEQNLPSATFSAKGNYMHYLYGKIKNTDLSYFMVTEDGHPMTKDIDKTDFYLYEKAELVKNFSISSRDNTQLMNASFITAGNYFPFSYTETMYEGNYYWYEEHWGWLDISAAKLENKNDQLDDRYKIKNINFIERDGQLYAAGSFYTSDKKYTLGAMMVAFDQETGTWGDMRATSFPEKLEEMLNKNGDGEFAGYFPNADEFTNTGKLLFYYNGKYSFDKDMARKMKLTDGEQSMLMMTIQLADASMNVLSEYVIGRYVSEFSKVYMQPIYMEDIHKIVFVTRDVNNTLHEKKRMSNLTTSIRMEDTEVRVYVIDPEQSPENAVSYKLIENKDLFPSGTTVAYYDSAFDDYEYIGDGKIVFKKGAHLAILSIR